MPHDPDTDIGGHADRFPLTRLSLLEDAAASDALDNDALNQVVTLYWKPVYKYIRLKWNKNNEEAKDLTQSFFASAVERDLFKRFDPRLASFRTYLRMALDRFAASDYTSTRRQKRGGDIAFSTIDFDGAEIEAVSARTNDTPEDIFHREWQRQLFTIAIDDLRQHCIQSSKQLHFSIFEAYDLAEQERPAYADLAQRYNITTATLNNHLAWARRMLRTFVMERLRGVTSGDRELRDEIRSAFGKIDASG